MKNPLLSLALFAIIAALPGTAAESKPAAGPPPAAIDNREQLVAVGTRVLQTWEQGDSAGFLAAFADDAVFAYPGGRIGKAKLGALFADLHTRKRDVKIYVGPFIVLGNEFALRYQFACTDRVTGRRQAVGTGVRGTLRDGKIVTFKEYWDGHIAPEQAAGRLPLDEGNPLFPIAAGVMMTPERVN
jgi:ketosteroid isomerase-like protein